MKNLPNINFTLKEIEEIVKRDHIVGGEAGIYETGNQLTLYKIFCKAEEIRNSNSYSFNSSPITTMSYNKLRKLEKLYQMQLEHSVRPISTISVAGELVGYEMTRDPKDQVITSVNLSRSELIHYLEQTKNILEYFSHHDIIYGDVAKRNILINHKTRTAKFCDMDNIKLGSYGIDVKSWELISYTIERDGLDQKTDAYMHSLMTLTGLDIDMDLCVLQNEYFHKHFTPPAFDVIEGIGNPKNYNGEYLVQYVKK